MRQPGINIEIKARKIKNSFFIKNKQLMVEMKSIQQCFVLILVYGLFLLSYAVSKGVPVNGSVVCLRSAHAIRR